jgi:integrase
MGSCLWRPAGRVPNRHLRSVQPRSGDLDQAGGLHQAADSHEAVALIRLRRDAVSNGCPFLFPSDVPGQPVVELKRFWERMRVQAVIPDVRIHDLRHTFASLLVSGGASLEMIGRLLGHTQIGTTQRYAHLIDSPLRAGVNAVGEMLKPRLRVVGGLDETG